MIIRLCAALAILLLLALPAVQRATELGINSRFSYGLLF